MPRTNRQFTPQSFDLEGRQLLTAGPSSSPIDGPPVQFVNPTSSKELFPVQIATQNAGSATVWLSRQNTVGSIQVQVTNDPNSLGVGANVGVVNQTVTFADGQSLASVNVPIIPGAQNPGEVDVMLQIKPVTPPPANPYMMYALPLNLRVVASDPTAAPKVVSEFLTDQGFVATFNKPMDPAGASNVSNYTVNLVNIDHHTVGGMIGWLVGARSTSVSANSLRIKSAQYDSATQSVIVTFKHSHYGGSWLTSFDEVHPKKAAIHPRHKRDTGPGVTDTQGNSVNAATTTGKISFRIKNANLDIGL